MDSIKEKRKKGGILWKDFKAGRYELPDSGPDRTEPSAYGIHLGTGGSSGIPKLVNLTNQLLNNVVKQHILMDRFSGFNFSYERGDTLLDVIPPHLGYGICDIHLALSMGLTLAIEPNPDPALFLPSIERYRPQFILAAPVHWKEYYRDAKLRNHSFIKTAVSGGEKLDWETENLINDRLCRNSVRTALKEGVGMTEVAGVATYNSSVEDSIHTVGRPLPEYRVGIFRIDTEEGVWDGGDSIAELGYAAEDGFSIEASGMLGEEHPGEICYLLPIDIYGYIGKREPENRYLIRRHPDGKNWIHTGDIGYIREDRNLVVADRIKRVFNRRSFKVYPAALENEAMSSGLLKECVVIERKSENDLEVNVPVMYAVLADCIEEGQKCFEEFCSRNFRETSSIYQIIYMDELPKTGAGKKAFKYLKEYDAKTFPAARGTEQASCSIFKTDLLNGERRELP